MKKKFSYRLKCRKRTRNRDIHKALTLLNLVPQQISKCKDCNDRKSVFVKEYKPNKSKNSFHKV